MFSFISDDLSGFSAHLWIMAIPLMIERGRGNGDEVGGGLCVSFFLPF